MIPLWVSRAAVPAVAKSTRRVRVCIVAPSLDILGGQAVQADRLLQRLRSIPTLEVGFLPVNPRLPGMLRVLQSVKYVRTVVTSLAYALSLLRRIPRCDVVHAFSASYFSFLLAPTPAQLAARLFGIPFLLNYHSGEAEDHLQQSRLATRLMRRADVIVTPSDYLVGIFARFGLQAVAIHNFVDVEEMPYRARPAPAPVFLSNRNLQPLYNVACVLRAFARIQQAVPDATLLVAGFGPEAARLEALARELQLRNVEWLGRVSPKGMYGVYDRADVYLNAPDIDNMPLSILEASACGLPVVSTDTGGIPFIVENERTGLLVPRNDDLALANAALRVLRTPALALSLATAARERVARDFSWSAVAPRWESLYQRLAEQTLPRGAGTHDRQVETAPESRGVER